MKYQFGRQINFLNDLEKSCFGRGLIWHREGWYNPNLNQIYDTNLPYYKDFCDNT